MAKGRRLTTSRSDHVLGAFNGVARGHGYGTVTEESEFREEDIWSIDDREDNNNNNDNNNDRTKYFSGDAWDSRAEYGRREVDDVSRRARIPRRDNNRHVGGLSLAFEETPSPRVVHQYRGTHDDGGGDGVDQSSTPRRRHHHHVAASAPVNVPDWNRILHRVDSTESMHDSDEMTGFENDENDGGGWFPPHEYLARSRKSAATSVFEGVGRTLKGRDLSRLRDAVWSQTGFDG